MNSGSPLGCPSHLCWQVPEMQRRQSPALAQSEDVEQVSPHWAAATGMMGVTGVTGSGLYSSSPASHLCWQVPEMQSLQSPAAAQSEEVVHASPQVTAP